MFFTPTNPTQLGNIGINFITALTNDLSASTLGDEGLIFLYKTGYSDSVDAQNIQLGLINKVYIDSIISAQMGYDVNDLYIVGPGDTDGGFGALAIIDEVMEETFGSGYNRYAGPSQPDRQALNEDLVAARTTRRRLRVLERERGRGTRSGRFAPGRDRKIGRASCRERV